MKSKTEKTHQYGRTIAEILKLRANNTPNKIVYSVVDSKLNIKDITYYQLFLRVVKLAKLLLKHKIGKNDRCLLNFNKDLEFTIAYLACNFIGAIPVPLNIKNDNTQLKKVEKITNNTHTKCIVTEEIKVDILRNLFIKEGNEQLRSIPIYCEDDNEFLEDINEINPKVNEIAFLQYTSGSTGDPKGVVITNASLLNNMNNIEKNCKFTKNSTMFNWLSFYHDLGLIYGVLQAIYSGGKAILMSSDEFMRCPMNWLRGMSIYKATHTSAPNFAYELIANEIDKNLFKNDNIDLSSLKVALCAGEPVNINTLETFNSKCKMFKLKKNVVMPAYGLAEATLFVSTYKENENVGWIRLKRKDLENGVINIIERGYLKNIEDPLKCSTLEDVYLVGNGRVINDHDLFIKNNNIKNTIGEVCFSGASLSTGYWNNEKATIEIFENYENDTEIYLKTGDLGFIDSTGELYIAGRKKDLIIIQGVNYYPQDIERVSFNANLNLVKEGAAAFSAIDDYGEKLILIQEVSLNINSNKEFEKLSQIIRKEILKVHSINVDTILLVQSGSIPRTVSGKIQRRKSKKMFLDKNWEKTLWISNLNEYSNLDKKSVKIDSIECLNNYITKIVSNEIGINISNIDKDIAFMELGVNSMMSLKIRNSIEKILKLKISPTIMFNYNTINKISEHLYSSIGLDDSSENMGIKGSKEIDILDLDKCSKDEIIKLLEEELGGEKYD